MPRKCRLRFCVDKLDRQDGQGKLVVTAGAESFEVPRNKILSRVELCRLAGVEDELLAGLVDGVVGEVHELLVAVLCGNALVLLRAEARQPIAQHVQAQRAHCSDEDVNAQIEFMPISFKICRK